MCEPGVVWCEEQGSVTHWQESLCLVVPVSCQDMYFIKWADEPTDIMEINIVYLMLVTDIK